MSRSRSRHKRRHRQRDFGRISNLEKMLTAVIGRDILSPGVASKPIPEVSKYAEHERSPLSDRREWSPAKAVNIIPPPLSGSVPDVVRSKKVLFTPLIFPSPQTSLKSAVCPRRRKRRQVLFSTRKAGKGHSGPRRRRYTKDSKIRCR